MTTYWSFKSHRKGECAHCGANMLIGDIIYGCENKYFDRLECVLDVFPNATKEQPNTRSNDGGNDVVTESSTTSTTTNARAHVRWEIVTGDDGIIVLRRLP